jgi:polar amino acid transport system substrate-binding protein
MRNHRLIAGAVFLALTVLAGCGGDEGGTPATGQSDCTPAHPGLTTVREGTLTVAAAHYPPFMLVEGTKLAGPEGDIINELVSRECLTLTAQALDHPSSIAAARSGRVDISAGNWYCTAERAKVMTLAGPQYTDQMAIISTAGAKTFSELDGKTVGLLGGSLWEEDFKQMYGENLKIYPNATAMFQDLGNNRVDAVIDSYGGAVYVNEQQGGKWKIEIPVADDRVPASKQPAQICLYGAKANEALATAFTEDIEKMRNEGVIAKLLEKYNLDPSAAETGELRLIG